jgi:hypothetical protein
MKFYLEVIQHEPLGRRRRAHIVQNRDESIHGCLCKAALNFENWLLVEELPEDIHLCKRCDSSSRKNLEEDKSFPGNLRIKIY